jgi:hypothetical protein
MREYGSEEDNEERSLIKGEDTKGAADVKVEPPVARFARVPENAGDEKPRENEEQGYAVSSTFDEEADASEHEIARLSAST